MNQYSSFACTHLGFSHVSANKICQDFSLTVNTEDFQAVIVSDGHGSNNFVRSDRGSRFACEASEAALKEFSALLKAEFPRENQLAFFKDSEQMVRQLCKNILMRWNQKINQDVAAEPFTEEEVKEVADKYRLRYLQGDAAEHAYGATLIIALVTRDFFLAIRNGDGECVVIRPDGTVDTPIPWNDSCEFNVTTSLCDPDAINDFRFYYSEEKPAAVYIGSDGVDDSYPSKSELFHLYRSLSLLALQDGPEKVKSYVEQFLPELTRRGSADDVSIAGLLNLQSLQTARAPMEAELEERKKQLAEAERKRQEQIRLRDEMMARKKVQKLTKLLEQLEQDLEENQNKVKDLPGYSEIMAAEEHILQQQQDIRDEIAEMQAQIENMSSGADGREEEQKDKDTEQDV